VLLEATHGFAKPSFQSRWPDFMVVDLFITIQNIQNGDNRSEKELQALCSLGPTNVESCPSGRNKGKTDQGAERKTLKPPS
jgi:hypothetical protein